MKKTALSLALAASLALILAACSSDPADPDARADKALGVLTPDNGRQNSGVVVVANRASGTISVIDSRTATLTQTVALPQVGDDAFPEPMYVNQVGAQDHLFVGDRANDRVVAFDPHTFDVVGTVPCGQGVFHMWGDQQGDQLWVNNDIDNTITVIDPVGLSVLATVPVPADLVALGGKPHDVILDHRSRYAYVTVLGVDGPNDFLLQFETDGFGEMTRQPVGQDPHVSINVNSDLYVACQNSDQVLVFDSETLDLLDEIAVPGAHGVAMTGSGEWFFTTNLPGGGSDAIYTIGTRRNEVAGTPADTPYPVPHNLVVTPDEKKLFVTHSGGTADKVTVYDLVGPYRQPVYAGEVTVGLNPFGIGYVY